MSLKNYATQLADMTSSMMKEKGFRHPAALLRDYGRTMAFDAQTFAGARGKVHECYKNAGQLALDGDGTYCEGYISVHGVPLEHAWIWKNGRVLDPTVTPKGVTEYYGIPVKTDYLRKTVLKTRVWGVLGAMHNPGILTDDPSDIVGRL